MIITRLVDYYDSISDEMTSSYFSRRDVDIEVHIEGDEIIIQEANKELEAVTYARCEKSRSGASVEPKLINDKAEYLFGDLSEKSPEDFNNETFKDFRDKFEEFYRRVEECFEATGNAEVEKVLILKERREELHEKLQEVGVEKNHWCAVFVNGKNPLDNEDVKRHWEKKQEEYVKAEREGIESDCLACGENRPVMKRHDSIKLTSVGGNSSGSSVVSINKKAFSSYGFKNAENSPVCFNCSQKYADSLKYLLDKDDHNLFINDNIFLMWSEDRDEETSAMIDALSGGDFDKVSDVREHLSSIFTGRPQQLKGKSNLLVISANSSRVIIRDFQELDTGDSYKNIMNYLENMRFAGDDYFTLYSLANALLPPGQAARDDLPSDIMTSLVNYALKGTPLPQELLMRCLQRDMIESLGDNYYNWKARIVLMKMYYNSQKGGDFKVAEDALEANEGDVPFLCGRLFAVVERIQYKALGETNTSVKDKYYSTAATSPANALPIVVNNAHNHLSKLENQGDDDDAYYLERDMNGLLSKIAEEEKTFPAQFSMEEQGKFALGYAFQKEKAFKTQEEGDDQ